MRRPSPRTINDPPDPSSLPLVSAAAALTYIDRMHPRHPRRPRERSIGEIAVTVAVAATAGGTSRWLFDAPAIVLIVLAVGVLVLLSAFPKAPVVSVVIITTAAAVVVQLPRMSMESVVTGLALGLTASMCLAVPLLIAASVRQRQAFERRGWALAAAEGERRASEVSAAVQRERMALAADIHDGLGHSLTLVAVRLGQLSLARALTEPMRSEVAEVRRLASEAADELGVAVRLLRSDDATDAGRARMSLDDILTNARNAGVAMSLDVPETLEKHLNQETATALARAIREALTNAAKHAPAEAVDVRVRLNGAEVILTVRNAIRADAEKAPTSTGFGLVGIRHRAAVLGGSLDIAYHAHEFVLILRLPTHARPEIPREPDLDPVVSTREEEAQNARDRATRMAFAVPAAIASALAFVAVSYFILSNILSVLPADRFATLAIGDDRTRVERALPSLELLDPPRDLFPPEAGEECRYYEASISFFDRVDVFVVCFDGGSVSRTGTVPTS